MIESVISHAILDTRAIKIVSAAMMDMSLVFRVQMRPNKRGMHRNVNDIHKNTLEALSASKVVVGTSKFYE